MKKSHIFIVSLSLSLCSNLALANSDRCAKISGAWDGLAKIKTALGICEYTARANFTNFTNGSGDAKLIFSKKTGNASCSVTLNDTAVITCNGEAAKLDSSISNLKGTVMGDGLRMILSGIFKVHDKDYPAELDIHKN